MSKKFEECLIEAEKISSEIGERMFVVHDILDDSYWNTPNLECVLDFTRSGTDVLVCETNRAY